MTTNKKLTLKDAASFTKVNPISISRLSKSDPTFPPYKRVGRSVFIDSIPFFKWLSDKAGKPVNPEDTL